MHQSAIRRGFSLCLILVLVLSVFSGLTLTASAATYAHNSSLRGVVCTSLSSAAQSYWTGTYSYTNLSSQSGDTLRASLRAKITSNRSTVGYDGLKTYFPYTDCYQGDTSKVWLFYANVATSSEWNANSYWNREHMWPDSLGGNAMEGDLHSMRPTDAKANSTRGNSKYANVRELYPGAYSTATTNATNGSVVAGYYYSSTYFEPLDVSKGDAARVLLYDYVVTDSMSSPTVAIKDIQTLLEWHALDPVDEYEMERNDIVQSIEGCRNPFVDYPELAWRLYTDYTMPTDMATPSNGGASSAYTITATSNNTNYGTVSLNGTVITASPKTGYYASGYTVTSGSATVTQNGNTFTVNPSSDCTVRINFAAKTSVTVTYMANGVQYSTASGYAGDPFTLPSTATAVTDWTLFGWSTATVNSTTDKPTCYEPGGSFTPTANITLYAVYKQTDNSGSGDADSFTLLTASPDDWEGEYVLTNADAAKVLLCDGTQTVNSANAAIAFANTGITKSGDTLTNVDDKYILVIENVSGSNYSLKLKGSSSTLYLMTADSNSGFNTASSRTANTAQWTLSANNGGATITNVDNNRIIRYNSSGMFRAYSSGQEAVYLYRGTSSGTTTYTTSPVNCAHSSLTAHPAVAATCTTDGNIAYWECNTCHALFSNSSATTTTTLAAVTITATGHTPAAAVEENRVEATTTTAGSYDSVVYCSVCHAELSRETVVIPALGVNYTVSFTVPAGVTAVASMTCNSNGSITLPTAENFTKDGVSYTFQGWVTADVNNSETAPATILTGSYTATGNITLKALYKYSVGGSDVPTFSKVSSVTSGKEYLIVYSDHAFDSSRAADNVASIGVTDNNGVITTDDSYAVTITDSENSGKYNVLCSNGKYIGRESSSTNGMDLSDSAIDVTITYSNNTFQIVGAGGKALGANSSNSYKWRFFAASNAYTKLDLYEKQAGGTTYYTTAPETSPSCMHDNPTHVEAVAATCVDAGHAEYWYCAACQTYFSDSACTVVTTLEALTIPATGSHTYSGYVSDGASGHHQVCSVCQQASETAAHTLRSVVTAPTVTQQGYTTYSCSLCDYELISDYTAATGFVAEAGYVYRLTDSIANGDKIAIAMLYNNTDYALSFEAYGSALNANEVTVNGTILTPVNKTAIFTVQSIGGDATVYYLVTEDGRYLTAAAGSSLTLTDTPNEYSQWLPVQQSDSKLVLQVYTYNYALEYYNGMFRNSAYNASSVPETKQMSLYKRSESGSYTVTYHTPAGVSTPAAETVAEGTTITLPTEPSGTPTDYTFLGWTTQSYAVDNTTVVIPISNSYTVNANADLYALYTYSDGSGSGTTSSSYVSTAAADVDAGQYVIGALKSSSSTSNMYFATTTISSGDITVTGTSLAFTDESFDADDLPSGAAVFTLTGNNTDGFTIEDGNGNYLGYTASSNRKLAFDSAYSTTKWKAVAKENSNYTGNNNGLYLSCTTGTYTISENSTGSGAIRGYANTTAYRGIFLFKLTTPGGGTDYYTTEVANANCEHNGTLEHVAANAATCTTDGNSEYWHCTDCGKYFSDANAQTQIAQGDTVIAALGHTPGSTYGYDGSNHWHICSVCGEACDDATTHSFDSNGECVCGATAMLYAKATTLHEGDHVVLYYPTGTVALTATASGTKLAGVAATVENDRMFAPGDAVVMVVEYVDETEGTFKLKKLDDTTYLTSGATGNGLSFAAAAGENDTDYAIWLFDTDTISGVTAIKNLNAVYTSSSGTSPQFMEYYNGFTTYSYRTSNDANIYAFEFYACAHAHPVKTDGYAATCTEAGLSDYWTCPDCGKVFSDAACTTETTAAASVIPALGHDLTATTAVEATCTVAGNSAYWTCNTCDKYFSDENGENEIVEDSWVIPATGHTPAAAVEENRVDATNTTTGSYDSVVYCSVCHAELSRETVTIPALMPIVVGESLTVGGDIDVNLYMAIPAELTQNNSNLTVKLYDGDTLLDTQAVDDAHLTANGYKFQIAKPAKNIQDTVTLKLFNGDQQVAFVSNGTECNELTYSVQIYLESVINNADAYEAQYPGLVDLCKAMSDYGSLAMLHKNYNAASAKALYNAEALAGIDTDTAWLAGDPNDVTVTGNIEGLSFYGASLVMESEMAIRFYFRYTGSANLTCNGEALKANGSYLYVEVSNIDATKFAEGKTVTVSDGANTYTVSGYSVHTYIRQQLQKVKDGKPYDETLVNLVRAIALYGFKAEAFFPANP